MLGMIGRFLGKVSLARRSLANLSRMDEAQELALINQGTILSRLNQSLASTRLADFEFKVFSQWGEDGIIQRLTEVVEIPNKTFIEFGVEDFMESNCRFLMMKDNWRGFVIDGSAQNIERLRASPFFWKHDLNPLAAFITKDNINQLLEQSGFDADLGLLSVDIDGNDYYVLEAITGFRPRILVCEYNNVFGGERKISVPYDPHFRRMDKHHSGLYFGASLPAMVFLAQRKGYTLVGVNTAGGNAFFVRNDLMTAKLEALQAADAYAPSPVRESRDVSGKLTFVGGQSRIELIKGLPVFNVETLALEPL
jgi:hypothetical protein